LLAVTDREELEDVLDHEISHINNYDTRLRCTRICMAGL
jgi:Zn-dependent protease with chaperone function